MRNRNKKLKKNRHLSDEPGVQSEISLTKKLITSHKDEVNTPCNLILQEKYPL